MKVAILVDGGFYRKRTEKVKGHMSPQQFADELYSYCTRHLYDKRPKPNVGYFNKKRKEI